MNKGYTLLYAVLLSGVVLIVGLSIMLIGKKEMQLSVDSSASMQAIYAADTGIECMTYYDLKDVFKVPSVNTDWTTIYCNGNNPVAVSVGVPINDAENPYSDKGIGYRYSPSPLDFNYILGSDNTNIKSSCFGISAIEKYYNATMTVSTTTIRINGYNTCDPDDMRRVQRTLEVTY